MVLEDRFASATLEDCFATLHSKNFKALRADLQGLCPIFKPQAIRTAPLVRLEQRSD